MSPVERQENIWGVYNCITHIDVPLRVIGNSSAVGFRQDEMATDQYICKSLQHTFQHTSVLQSLHSKPGDVNTAGVHESATMQRNTANTNTL